MNTTETAQQSILFINFSQGWGGGEYWHLLNCMQMIAKGLNATLLASRNSKLEQKARAQNIQVYSIDKPSLWNPATLLMVNKIFKELKPSAVILNGTKELKICSRIAKSRGVQKVIFRRGIQKCVSKSSTKYLKKYVTDVVLNSQATYIAMRNSLKCSGLYPGVIIHNGIII